MLETSKDILYIVIAFCVLWVTIFLCWMFYYVARLLRNANQIIEEFRLRLQALTDAINNIRHKVEVMHNLFTMATSGVGGLIKKAVEKKTKQWVDTGTENFNEAAKNAVSQAVKATAKRMKRVAKKAAK